MCGIFGVWNFKGVEGRHVHRASSLLAHRGPDGEGILIEADGATTRYAGRDFPGDSYKVLPDDLPVTRALLHRRLSIIDLSPQASQPMQLADRNIFIVFNGEIYNYRELAQRFGLTLQTASDTEVILALYDKLGTETFAEMRGMWALAILDLERRQIVLSRDRFGIKPLYWTMQGEALAFSSELKPLLQLPGMRHTWSKKRFLEYVTFGATTDADETFAEGISALSAGGFAVYDLQNGRLEATPYYNLPRFGDRKPTGGFRELFQSAMAEHLVSDVEVGSCLSGGVDSSLIVAEAARRSNRLFQTFTCSFPGESVDETSYAQSLAEVVPNLNQHFVTPTSVDLLSAMDDLVLLQERPIGSASIFAQYSVMKLVADRGVKVVLDGQGADEVFGGYYPFAGAFLLTALRKGRFGDARRGFTDLKKYFNPRMEVAMLRAGYYALPAVLQSAVRRSGRVGYDLLSSGYRGQAKSMRGPQRGSPDFNELTARSIKFGLKELLQYEDRNSMHFGVESRVPFLDHRLVEWSVLSPPESKLHKGWTKWPLRKSLEEHGARDHAWRIDKLGFVAPQEKWRNEIAAHLPEMKIGEMAAEFFDHGALRRIFTGGLENNEDRTAFWRVFFLLKWLEAFKVDIV